MQHAINELTQYPTLNGEVRGIPSHVNYFDEAFHGESELYEVLSISGQLPMMSGVGGRYDGGKWVLSAFIADVFWSVCHDTLEDAVNALVNVLLED